MNANAQTPSDVHAPIALQDFPVGFIGLGVMGQSMARRLLAAGFPVHAHTRTRAKAESLLAAGARWEPSVAAVAPSCRAVITMLGFPEDVEAVYFGAGGLLETARPGTLLIDMTTSSPGLAARIQAAASARGLPALDAPVSGGDVGAREGRLSIMAGGSKEAFAAAQPLFAALGQRSVLHGAGGCGQRAKLCNQIAVFGNTLGTCEALAFALKAGLDPDKVLLSISSGAASSWALHNLAPRILDDDFAPGFLARHFLKDIRLALDEAAALGWRAPGLELARDLYTRLIDQGMGAKGTQALFLLLRAAGA